MSSLVMATHVELWPIDKLIPFARNPRTHSDAQVAPRVVATLNAMASSGKQRTTARPSYSTRLDLFAKAFPTEDYLRKVLADLFRKMGHSGVRITHGSNEKGKDIVFYREGPLHEKKLFACVVKNEPITGQAEDYRSGAPTIVAAITHGVLNQITSASNESSPDNKGGDERVDTVYVISPYECSVAARESVKGSLERSGQIHLICGQQLLELFIEHWPEFLWFESAVLTSYLSALHKNAAADYELANLILQKSSYLHPAANSILDRYVEPTCYRDLRPRHLVIDELLSKRLLTGDRYLSELRGGTRAPRGDPAARTKARRNRRRLSRGRPALPLLSRAGLAGVPAGNH